MAKNNRNEMYNKFAQVANKNINKNQPNNSENKETKMNQQYKNPTNFNEFNAIVAALKEKAVSDKKAALLHVFGNGVMASMNHVINMVPDQEEREKMLASEELFSKFTTSTHGDENAKAMMRDMVVYLNGGKTMLDEIDVDEQLVSELNENVTIEVESSKKGVEAAFAAAFPNGVPTETAPSPGNELSVDEDAAEAQSSINKDLGERLKAFKKEKEAKGIPSTPQTQTQKPKPKSESDKLLDELFLRQHLLKNRASEHPKTINELRELIEKITGLGNVGQNRIEWYVARYWNNVIHDFNEELAKERSVLLSEYNGLMGSEAEFKKLTASIDKRLLDALVNSTDGIYGFQLFS